MRKQIGILVLLILAITVLLVFPAEAMFGLNYSSSDVAVINTLIKKNGLDAEINSPDSWDFVEWYDDESYNYIKGLYLEGRNLSGDVSLENCTKLEYASLAYGSITSLNVSGCCDLLYLFIINNQISSIDLTGVTALRELYCSNNPLDSLDVSGLDRLEKLFCAETDLTTLDLLRNTTLTALDCGHTPIESVNLLNATALEELYLYDCPELKNIVLHDRSLNWAAADSTMGTIRFGYYGLEDEVFGLVALSYPDHRFSTWSGLDTAEADPSKPFAQGRLMPDQHLTATANFDYGKPDIGDYCQQDVDAVNAMIEQNNLSASMSMPETWWFAEWDGASPNRIFSLTLNDQMLIGALDVTPFTNLEWLSISNNMLTSLDASDLGSLRQITAFNNELVQIKLDGLNALNDLDVQNNQLSTLDVSSCPMLSYINAGSNPLSMLAATGAERLQTLSLYGCRLDSFIVQGRTFKVSADLNGQAWINWLSLIHNIIEVEAAPATDTAIFSGWEGLNGDPLSCRLTASVGDSGDINAVATYTSTDDPVPYNADDTAAIRALIDATGLDADPDNPDSWGWFVSCIYDEALGERVISHITLCDLGLAGDVNITGFSHLQQLDISGNNLSGVDLSGLNKLSIVILDANPSLSGLALSGCKALSLISIDGTAISSLDVSAYTALETISCFDSAMTDICWSDGRISVISSEGGSASISWVTLLDKNCSVYARPNENKGFAGWSGLPDERKCLEQDTSFDIADGEYYILEADFADEASYWQDDVSMINAMITYNGLHADPNTPQNWDFVEWYGDQVFRIERLDLSGCGLTGDVIIQNCPTITAVYLGNNGLTSIQINNCVSLNLLIASNNPALEMLDLIDTPDLYHLEASNTCITSIDTTALPCLEYLFCQQTPITVLDMSANPRLRCLDCGFTQISQLDISSMTELEWFSIYHIPTLTSLSLPDRSITLTAQGPGGSARIQSDSETYEIILIAIPRNGYVFTGWTDLDVDDPASLYQQFTLDEGMHINPVATFEEGEPDVGNYSLSDVYVINEMISSNGLSAVPSAPESWEAFAEWNYDAEPYRIRTLNLNGIGIVGTLCINNLSGLESLDTNNNILTDILIDNMPMLELVCVMNCGLTQLSLNGLDALNHLNVNENRVSSLDFSDCPNLSEVTANNNPSLSIDVSMLANLKELSIYGCDITRVCIQGHELKAEADPSEGGFAAIQEVHIDDTAQTATMFAYAYSGYVFKDWSVDADISDIQRSRISAVMKDDESTCATASFVTRNDQYDADDIAAMQGFIETNGWQERVDIENPDSWSWFATWYYDAADQTQHISELQFCGQGLGDTQDFTAFANLRELVLCDDANVQSINVAGMQKLALIEARDNPNLNLLVLDNTPVLEDVIIDRSGVGDLDLSSVTSFKRLTAYCSALQRVIYADGSVTLSHTGDGLANIELLSMQDRHAELRAVPDEAQDMVFVGWANLPDMSNASDCYTSFNLEMNTDYMPLAEFALHDSNF